MKSVFHVLKDCEVDVILSQHKMNNGAVIGSELSNKLKERGEPTEQERRFLIRTMGRYLMNNCARYLLLECISKFINV